MDPHGGAAIWCERVCGCRYGDGVHAGARVRQCNHGRARRAMRPTTAAARAAGSWHCAVCPAVAVGYPPVDPPHRCGCRRLFERAMARAAGAGLAAVVDAAGGGDGRRISIAAARLEAVWPKHRDSLWQQYARSRCWRAVTPAALAQHRLEPCDARCGLAGSHGRCGPLAVWIGQGDPVSNLRASRSHRPRCC